MRRVARIAPCRCVHALRGACYNCQENLRARRRRALSAHELFFAVDSHDTACRQPNPPDCGCCGRLVRLAWPLRLCLPDADGVPGTLSIHCEATAPGRLGLRRVPAAFDWSRRPPCCPGGDLRRCAGAPLLAVPRRCVLPVIMVAQNTASFELVVGGARGAFLRSWPRRPWGHEHHGCPRRTDGSGVSPPLIWPPLSTLPHHCRFASRGRFSATPWYGGHQLLARSWKTT